MYRQAKRGSSMEALQLTKIAADGLPDIFSKIDITQGDGGAGTVLELFFAPGMKSYKEKFTVVDHKRRAKETEVVEGGYLNLGFTPYRIRLEVMENRCITKATIEYEVKEEVAANASLLFNAATGYDHASCS